jgi:predicted nucleic acid-binding protein
VTDKVVDASAVVALLFNELTREEVVPRLRGASLHAPDLIRYEVPRRKQDSE